MAEDSLVRYEENPPGLPMEQAVLARMEAARAALAEAQTLGQAKQVADGAAAIVEWLRRQSEVGLEIVNEGNLLRLQAEGRMGEFLKQPETVRRQDDGLSRKAYQPGMPSPPTLRELGISPPAAQRYRQVAAVPVERLRAMAQEATANDCELTREAVLRAAKNPTGTLRDCLSVNSSDHFQTPVNRLLPLVEHLDPSWTIWECAEGSRNLSTALEELGFEVIGSDLSTGQDFLTWEPPLPYDCIVTNPPYSLKDEFLIRCYQLGKPFALFLPLTALGEQKRLALYRERGIQLVLPHERTNFETPSGDGSGAWFFSAWFLGYFNLPRDLNFWRPE